MKNNRRNYYRILQSQPDATQEVIKANYRTLLQKLKMHPDLGGENWNASLITQAYHTLRNPAKRAAYDQALLRRHKLSSLSRGPFSRCASRPYSGVRITALERPGNKRNYYRVLHVQPDSPAAIIEASYRTLLHKPNVARSLLKEAYQTLVNHESRTQYDRLLAAHCHAEILTLLQNSGKNMQPVMKRDAGGTGYSGATPTRNREPLLKSVYQPLIKRYCVFCKTPCMHVPGPFIMQACMECGSPLEQPQSRLTQQSRRFLDRIRQSGLVHIYRHWPDPGWPAGIADLSPMGMQLTCAKILECGQLLKIDGADFKAVGEVTHRRIQHDQITVGIRFLTIRFSKQKGQFLSTSA